MIFIKYFPKNGDVRERAKYLLFPKSLYTSSSKTTYWLCKVAITEKYHGVEDRYRFAGWEVLDISPLDCKGDKEKDAIKDFEYRWQKLMDAYKSVDEKD